MDILCSVVLLLLFQAVTAEYADCQAWFDSGKTSSGVYAGIPSGSNSPTGGKEVYCDMDKGKGWLVFQRRQDGSVNFTRNWLEYKEGFGNLNGEFWLGNEALRLLTNVDNGSNWMIRVDLTGENGLQISLSASPFRISGDKYTISVGNSGIEGQRVCGEPIGMEDRSITDSRIKASSVYGLSDPDQSLIIKGKGRLNAGSSWCPKLDDKQAPWFQVDLYEQTQVVGVIMQGGTCLSGHAGWVKKYNVEYGCDQLKWNYVVGTFLYLPQISFDGNTNTDTPVTSMFDEPVQARYVRIRATEYNTWPTMRIELLGCEVRVLESLNGRKFSTYDNDNDNDFRNCAGLFKAGWWFDDCAVESNLNGEYSHRVNDSCQEYRGILWSTWQGRQIVKSVMKMRRNN